MQAAYDVATVVAAAQKAIPAWEAKLVEVKARYEERIAVLKARHAEIADAAKHDVAIFGKDGLCGGARFKERMAFEDWLIASLMVPHVPQLDICWSLAQTKTDGVKFVVLSEQEIEAIKPGLGEALTP